MTKNSHIKHKESIIQLFRQYYNPLCNYAYSILQNKAMSEDAVQDVFTILFEKRGELKWDTPRAYLFRSTRNRALEMLKSQNRIQAYTNHIQRQGIDPNEDKILADKYVLKEKLFNSIRQLPPKCQEIFLMSKTRGLTYVEIAEMLDISTKTVESQVGKALRLLRTKLH